MGTSGTIKSAHEVLLVLGKRDGFITPTGLDKLTSEVLKHCSFNTLSLPGLSEERKAVFVLGLVILCGVFDELAIRELRLSDGALRERVLYEMESRFRHQDVRSRTAKSLANQYNIDREQTRRVHGNHHADVQTVAGPAAKTGISTAQSVALLGDNAA